MPKRPQVVDHGTADAPFGFVFVDDVRLGYSPSARPSADILLWPVANEPRPSVEQVERAHKTLLKHYPGSVVVFTSEPVETPDP